MYAIVLTHTARLPFVQLLLSSYDEHWPDNGFVFRIPFDSVLPTLTTQQRVEFVPAARPIKHTMAALLAGIADDEFVYWCTDDRYLAKVYDRAGLREVCEHVERGLPAIDSLRLVNHTPRAWFGRPLIHEHRAHVARGFWHHQFLRAGVLRRIFVDLAAEDSSILEPHRELLAGHHAHVAYSATRSLVQFAEPTIGPNITANCVRDCTRYGIDVPSGYGRSSESQYFPARYGVRSRLRRV